MNSTNNFQHHEQQQQHHHHQQQQQHLQDHFVGCSPLINHPSSSPSYGLSTTSLLWNPNILSTTTPSDTFCNKIYENHNESSYQQSCNNNNFTKIEEDMLSSFPSFTALINNPTNMMDNSCSLNGFELNNTMQNSRGLMQFPLDHQEHQSNYSDATTINNWITTSHGFPSSNILHQLGLVPSPNNSTTSISSSSPRLGLNMQAMDLLGTNNASFGSHVLHEEAFSHARKNMPNKALAMTNAIAGTKRAAGSCSSDQSKASTTSNNTVPNKKSQLKVSCPPLKVRKEKLGDRIAALHQLVSPFGKTDTASVLTEAIGYIQFLQDQIHTLCMPNNAKPPSRNKLCKPFQMGQGIGDEDEDEDEDEDSQIDIRRRGLCLVPVSWTSYLTSNQYDASNTPSFFLSF